jgi:chromate transporter
MFALLPFWTTFRKWQLYRAALPGMNAASVGLILAAVFNMTIDVLAFSPFPTSTLCIGLFAFAAVDEMKIFEPVVVAGGVALGLLAWGADLR